MKEFLNYLVAGFTLSLFVIFVAATVYWGWIELKGIVAEWRGKGRAE